MELEAKGQRREQGTEKAHDDRAPCPHICVTPRSKKSEPRSAPGRKSEEDCVRSCPGNDQVPPGIWSVHRAFRPSREQGRHVFAGVPSRSAGLHDWPCHARAALDRSRIRAARFAAARGDSGGLHARHGCFGLGRGRALPGQTAATPMRHGAGHHDHGQKGEMPCPFGVLGAPAMPSAPPVVADASTLVFPAAISVSLPTRLSPGPAAPPPPSTGPPAGL